MLFEGTKHILAAITVLFSMPFLFSQSSGHIFEHLTTDYGLSSNKVESILQDHDGFYWIATQNGLNRFDGTNIRVYSHHPDDSTTLSHNNCTAIALDSTGDVWVATYHGVSRYQKKRGHFQRIFLQHPGRNDELANRIHNLAVDSTGNVWIAGNGLWRYNTDNDDITLFQSNNPATGTRAIYNVINQLQYDPHRHGLWLSTGVGIAFFDIEAGQFYNETYNPKSWAIFSHSRDNELTLDRRGLVWFRDQASQSIASFDATSNLINITPIKVTSGVRQIQADDEDRIWIFYWVQQAIIYEPATMTIDSSYFIMRHGRSVLSEQATSLYIDQYDNYWIASGSGISIYREANQYYRMHQLDNTMIQDHPEQTRILALAQTHPGSLWIGTSDGLFTYDLHSGSTKKITIPNTAPGVTTMLASNDKLWIGAHDLLTSIDPHTHQVIEQVILDQGIIFVIQDALDNVWAGLWSRGLFQLDKDGFVLRHFKSHPDSVPTIASNSLITALPDGDRLWIGYNAGLGFSGYEMRADTWKHFHPADDKTTPNMLSNAGTVTVITKGDKDHLWIGTHGGGIYYTNPLAKTYKAVNQSSGLNSNYINSILPDHLGRYWIATADGMNVLDSATHAIRSLDMNLAFRDNDFRQNGMAGLDGRLYFFFNNQIIEIDPKRYDGHGSPRRMVISRFAVLDNERPLPVNNHPIVLSHQENFFSFGFSVIKTHPMQRAQYAYRIQGFDKDWIYTEQPFANYTNVPHGRYTFQVKAKLENGTWGEPLITVPMRIHPPFWLTWWFITLAIVSISAIVYAVYRYRIQQIKKLMAVRARISRDLHDEVGSALSSIHVYSAVAEKSMDRQPQATRDALKVIHDSAKQVMENMGDIVWAINTGPNSEISLEKKLKNYGFELLTPIGIVTTYSIDPAVEQLLTQIEARKNVLLIAKEAMNNIARYSQATEATIAVNIADHQLRLHITDNGIGFDAADHKSGNGLYNMQKRTTTLGGVFTMETSPGGGTRILCHIPITSIRDN
jgi:ligand-binding sensor domain-containing protein